MPVSFSSPPRNLFLLGSSGADAVTNFFKEVDQSISSEDVYVPSQIRYNDVVDRYLFAGTAEGTTTNKELGWIEQRNYDPSVPSSAKEWDIKIKSLLTSPVDTTLRAMHLRGPAGLYVVGKTGTVPWVANYFNNGQINWQTSTNTADVEYTGITTSTSGVYACGNTSESGEAVAFVEKFDYFGNAGWGRAAFMLGRDVVLEKISANDRGEVIAVGYLEDDSVYKGYIVKMNAETGEIIWDRTLERNISGFGGSIGNDEIASANVKCTACYIDGNDQIYIVGSIDGNVPVNNGVGEFLVKYSPEGNMLWQRENNTEHYTNTDGAPNMIPFDVQSDTDTQQTVVLSVEDQGSFALNNSNIFLSKYSRDGSLVFRRQISKSTNNLGAASLDSDASFYYIMFRDQQINPIAGEPDRYFFGKVSTSGNGLGDFSYDDTSGTDVDYTIVSNAGNRIGRLSDGSLRNDTSDLVTYPFNANKIVFDDLATQVSNKKRQMDSADSFQYSSSGTTNNSIFADDYTSTEVIAGRNITIPCSVANGNEVTVTDSGHNLTTGDSVKIKLQLENPGMVLVNSSYATAYTITSTTPTTFTYNFTGVNRDGYTGRASYYDPGTPAFTDIVAEARYGSPAIRPSDFSELNLGTEKIITTETTGSGTAQGQEAYTTPGTYTWTAPANVTSVCVVCVGGGSCNGAALAYKNDVPVVPGTGYTVVVAEAGVSTGGAGGAYSDGEDSTFNNGTYTVIAEGGSGNTQTPATPSGTYSGGGNGGISGEGIGSVGYGGGGAGGYSGNGGNNKGFSPWSSDGAGGGGAGGAWAYWAGGGVGIMGEGASGLATSENGGGGSGGGDGGGEGSSGAGSSTGGEYGGGGSGRWAGNKGGHGAVRIIWGDGRSFPSTLTADQTPSAGSTTTTVIKSIDKSGKGNHAIVNGATLNYWDINTNSGNLVSRYWEFDGTDGTEMRMVFDKPLIPATGPWTAEGWVYLNTTNTTQMFMTQYLNGSDPGRFQMFFANDGTIRVHDGNGIMTGSLSDCPSYSANEWTHVVWQHNDNNENMIYVNGVKATSDDQQTTTSLLQVDTLIGSRYDLTSGVNFDGRIGEARVYPKALTAAQVFQNYNATKSKYINEAPDTAPKIGPGIITNAYLMIYYDFGNKACLDSTENLFKNNDVTNLVRYNATVNGKWCIGNKGNSGNTGSTVGPNVISPVGDLTGGTIVYDGSDASSGGGPYTWSLPGGIAWSYKDTSLNVDNQIQFVEGDLVTFSVFAKIGSSNKIVKSIYLRAYDPENAWWFNLETGTAAATASENSTTIYADTINSYGNGWYKCTMTFLIGSISEDEIGFQLYLANSAGSTGLNSPEGAGDTIHIWNPQVQRVKYWSDGRNSRPIQTYGTAITKSSTVKNLYGTSSSAYNASLVNAQGVHDTTDGAIWFFDNEAGNPSYLDLAGITLTETDGWTIEMWLMVQDPSSGNYANNAWNYFWRDALTSGSPAFEAGIYSDNNTNFAFKDNDTASTSVSMTMTPMQWHWISFGISNSGVTKMMYSDENGTFNTTNSGVAAASGSCEIDKLFVHPNGTQPLRSICGEIRIYNRELLTPEGTVNYNATRDKYGV